MKGLQLIPDDTHLDFIGKRYLAFAFSAILMLASIGLVATKGLNFGIDFTGGTVIEIKTPSTPDIGALRTELNGLGLGAISIQEFGAEDDLLIRLPQQQSVHDDGEEQKAAIETVRVALDARYGDFENDEGEAGVDYRRVEFVGPQVGAELKKQGAMAVLFSLFGILAYVWFRFEWQFGVASIVALAHDAVLTVGLFALTQMEFNLSTVAAVLMIAGYSINDTVVVFDRIRENLRKYKKMPIGELFNLSINNTLSRTLMTSATTVLALVALYVFGGEVLRGFIYALMFGIVIGTYSSIFVAAPLLMFMNIKRSDIGDIGSGGDVVEEDS
ncbi:MAG: protein translocase subunit SecF [Alphaproteobacteria bacterium]|nr:protein translocase subunit SecF [Alphaproteobacteria bacterium]